MDIKARPWVVDEDLGAMTPSRRKRESATGAATAKGAAAVTGAPNKTVRSAGLGGAGAAIAAWAGVTAGRARSRRPQYIALAATAPQITKDAMRAAIGRL